MDPGSEAPPRAVLIDDHPIIHEVLCRALESRGVLVVGQAGLGREGLVYCEVLRPDVVVLDLGLPDLDGLTVLRQLRERCPQAATVVYTGFADPENVARALLAGASAVLPKTAPTRHVVETVCRIASGGAGQTVREVSELLVPKAPEPAVRCPQPELAALSPRQRSLLPLLAQGLSNKEIAGRIGLAEGTVANYVGALMERLGARSRAHVAALASHLTSSRAGARSWTARPGAALAARQ